MALIHDTLKKIRERLEKLMIWKVWERLLEIEFIDRSIALAGKAFVSFFPLAIVVSAFLPERTQTSVINSMNTCFGFSGDAFETTQSGLASMEDIRKATGYLGLILTIFFATSFTIALQRMYMRAWRRPHISKGGTYIRGVIWLFVVLSSLAFMGAIDKVLDGVAASVLYSIIFFLVSTLVWWFAAWFLLSGEVSARVLIPTGLVSALAMGLYVISAQFWMTQVVKSNTEQFGFFGIALALVTWFSGAAICLLIGACAGPVLAEDDGAVGKFIRGKNGRILNEGAPPSLPAPVRALRLRDSFGSTKDM